MKRHLLICLLTLIPGFSLAQSPAMEWVAQIGRNCIDVATDIDGNVIVSGAYSGTVDFDPDTSTYNLTSSLDGSMFVLKLNSAGEFIWVADIVGPAGPYSLTIDKQNDIVIIGDYSNTVDFDPGVAIYNSLPGTSQKMFILKLRSNGSFAWVKEFDHAFAHRGQSIQVDESSNVYTTGHFQDVVDFDPGPGNCNLFGGYSPAFQNAMFVSKLDSAGNFKWAKTVGARSDGNSLTLDVYGNVYIIGTFLSTLDIPTIDFDPGPNVHNLTAVNYQDVYLLKLDTNGEFNWVKSFSTISNHLNVWPIVSIDFEGNLILNTEFIGTMDCDPGDGVYYLSSDSTGTSDNLIIKLDQLGQLVWAKKFGGNSWDYPWGLEVDNCGNIYSVGNFRGTSDFDPGPDTYNLTSAGDDDIYLSKLDPFGNFVWALKMGGPLEDNGRNTAVDENGSVYVVGDFRATSNFGSDSSTFYLTTGSASNAGFFEKFSQPTCVIPELHSELSVYVFPNPSTGLITIETKEPTNVIILNAIGQEMLNLKLLKSGKIDVSCWPDGIYFLTDIVNGGSFKFIKQ